MTRFALATVALLALGACSAPATTTSPATGTPTVAVSTSATPTPTAAAPRDATTLANLIKQTTTTKILTIDENNDPNNKIGRPGGYTSAATLYDSTVTCTDIGADCGATIEVYPTAAEAQARADYIQTILKASPVLGTEYDTPVGTALLRVTGIMKPSVAALYSAAMLKA